MSLSAPSESSAASEATERAERFDLERLERALGALLNRYRAVQEENRKLGRALEEREGRVRTLDGQLLEMNQRRQDAAKRIDDLLSQIDRIDAELGERDSEAQSAAP